MSRSRQWYLDTIKREERAIESLQESLGRYIRSADYSLAAQTCDQLKAALLSLNTCENKLADMDDDEEGGYAGN